MDHRENLPPGTLLDGSYRIKRVVGSGGFGITYEAEDVRLGTDVAIKEYYPFDYGERTGEMSIEPKSDRHAGTFAWGRNNFLQEARTLARFEHPSIVRVTRVFQAHSTAYMVMRFERGKSFEAWLQSLGRLPTQEELDKIVAPLLDALEILHAGNFLHRDIAPDNIIVRADGTPVLLDFGSARRSVAEMSKAMTGIVKAGYSPLEQYSSDNRMQGPWSDLYALGGTLYRAVAGRAPEEATLRIHDDRLPSASVVAKDRYRAGFLSGIDACLGPRQSQRPQSVAELRALLFAAEPPPSRGRVFERLKPSAEVISQVRSGAARVPDARWWVLAVGLFSASLAVGYFYLRSAPGDRSATTQIEQDARRLADAEAARRRAKAEAERKQKEAEEAKKREAEKRAQAEQAKQEAQRKQTEDAARARRNEALTHLEDGKLRAGKADHAGAIAEYDEAIRLDPNLAAAYLQRGVSLANMGEHARAITDYTRSLELEPRVAEAHYARGFSYGATGKYDEAIGDFDEAIRLNPGMAQAFWQRGAAYARKGDHTRAIAEYDEAIRQDPKFSRAYWSRGNSYEFKGDYDKAIADYDEAVRLDPKWANAYYDRGVVYAVKGDLERAVADYSEAIRLNPIASYYWRRGVAYSMRGANDQAIKDFDEALRLSPKLATAYWQRGVAHANAGDLTLASNDYDEAIRLDPTLARAYVDRGNLWAAKGDHKRAIADFGEAIRLEPSLASAYYGRGVSYAKTGDRVRAAQDYRKTLQLDPNHREARRELQGLPAR